MKKLLFILTIILAQYSFGQDTNSYRLEGKVFCDFTQKPIDSAKVSVVGTDGSRVIVFTDEKGEFSVDLSPNTSYSTIVDKPGHLIAKGKETTVDKTKIKLFYHEYELQYNPGCPRYVLPMLSFEHNSTKPIYVKELVPTDPKYLYQILKEFPELKLEVVGYRHEDERKGVSYKRAQNFVKKVLSYGINSQKIIAVDGGLGKDRSAVEKLDPHYVPNEFLSDEIRLIVTNVVSWDFKESQGK